MCKNLTQPCFTFLLLLLIQGPSNKVNMILDIWQNGYGVATVHVFHSVIPVEAYTREACMIEALGKFPSTLGKPPFNTLCKF